MTREADALEAQCAGLEAMLGSLDEEEWARPTRCPPLSVRELAGHVGTVLHRFAEALDTDFPEAVNCDRSSYFTMFCDQVAPVVIEESQESASARADAEMLRWCRQAMRDAVSAARRTSPDKVVGTRRLLRRLTAADFTATRVLDAAVHTMDIGHATLRGEPIDESAVPVVTGILDGLLGRSLPAALGWSAKTYILSGTGRRPVSATERHTLGPLGAKFPLLS